jgi:hypothetical protein
MMFIGVTFVGICVLASCSVMGSYLDDIRQELAGVRRIMAELQELNSRRQQ